MKNIIDFAKDNNWLYVAIVYPIVFIIMILFPLLDYFDIYHFGDDFFGVFNNANFIEAFVKGIILWGLVLIAALILAIAVYIGTFSRDRRFFDFKDCIMDIVNVSAMGGLLIGTIIMIVLYNKSGYEPIDIRIFNMCLIFQVLCSPCIIYSIYRIFACTPFLKILIRPLTLLIDLFSSSSSKAFTYDAKERHSEVRNDKDYEYEKYSYDEYSTKKVTTNETKDIYARDKYANISRVGSVNVTKEYEVPTVERKTGYIKKEYTQKRQYDIESGTRVSNRTGKTYNYSRTVNKKNIGEKKYKD